MVIKEWEVLKQFNFVFDTYGTDDLFISYPI